MRHNNCPLTAFLTLLVICGSCSTLFADGVSSTGGPSLGINLTELTYYSSELVFLDVMKQASGWSSGQADAPWIPAGPLQLSAQREVLSLAPGQMARCLTLRTPTYPPGRYICLYEGEGDLRLRFSCREISRDPGRIVLDVWSSVDGIEIDLYRTNAANPVRNIRLIREADLSLIDAGHVFRPEFLSRWNGFKILRFMDWQRTNNARHWHWPDRVTPDHHSQDHEHGVALEHMIGLCNALKADAWFCIPHEADNIFVRGFAQLVRSRLDPSLKVYVEYSNEIWNYGFQQGGYCERMGLMNGMSTDAYVARLRYQAARSTEIFDLFHEVFAGQTDRVVRVLAAQAAGLHTATTMLDWAQTASKVDVVAIAPYFAHDVGTPAALELGDDALLNLIETKMRSETFPWIDRYASEMAKRGKRLVAYEGGQHVVAYLENVNNELLAAKLTAINRHPRMRQLYTEYLNRWKSAGVGPMVLFNSMGRYIKWGSWGLMEFHGQDPATAPKYLAARDYLAASAATPPASSPPPVVAPVPTTPPPPVTPPVPSVPPVTPLSVTSVSPERLQLGTTQLVTIKGTGFKPGARLRLMNGKIGRPAISKVTVLDANTITVVMRVGRRATKIPRLWDLRVTNRGGETTVWVGALWVIP